MKAVQNQSPIESTRDKDGKIPQRDVGSPEYDAPVPVRKTSFIGNQDDVVYHQHINHHEHSAEHHMEEEHTHHTLNHGQLGDHKIFYVIDAEALKSGAAIVNVRVPMANPSPLGLLGFGLTTFLLNMHNAGVFENNAMIMAMGLCYGGLAQIIAGIFEFMRGDMFGMIAFLSYGCFWWSLILIFVLPKMGNFAPAPDAMSMGFYLFIWGCFSACMFVGTILKKAPLMLSWIFFTVIVLFMLLAITKWTGSHACEVVAGVEGVICGLSAIYMAFAGILNEVSGRRILPVGMRT